MNLKEILEIILGIGCIHRYVMVNYEVKGDDQIIKVKCLKCSKIEIKTIKGNY